jgi:hypothetical protein
LACSRVVIFSHNWFEHVGRQRRYGRQEAAAMVAPAPPGASPSSKPAAAGSTPEPVQLMNLPSGRPTVLPHLMEV